MPSDLWRFAQTLYAQPGVEDACLRLQAGGADVCLLLCGAWLERRDAGCDAQRLALLQALAAPWQAEVVAPLRRLRQGWRNPAASDPQLKRLREQIKGLELEAEQRLLQRLEAATRSWPERGEAVEGESPGAWLEGLAPGVDDEALRVLRAAALAST
ncbi:MAG: TIGR02444 family protein [Pseudomonadota bacterium]